MHSPSFKFRERVNPSINLTAQQLRCGFPPRYPIRLPIISNDRPPALCECMVSIQSKHYE